MSFSDQPRDDGSFDSVAEHAPAMLWRGDEAGRCVWLNRATRAFWGLSQEDVAGFSWASTLLPEDADRVFGPFAEGMTAQAPFRCEGRYRRADGEIRILETHAQPRFDTEGRFVGMVGVNSDVTEQRRAGTELAESEARFRALADHLPHGMTFQIITAEDGARRFTFVSSRCAELNGVPADEAMVDASVLYGLIEPEDLVAFAEAERRAIEGFTAFDVEARVRKRGSSVARWFRFSSAPRRGAEGEIIWDGVQLDIHDGKLAHQHQQLLIEELNHRVKNTLATVISIAGQTSRAAPTADIFNATFQARLKALAKTHELLSRERWASADLRELLELELLPYAEGGRGLTLEGPPLRLAARAAVSVGLVLHELATNAAKYGAYAGDGDLDVRWTLEDEDTVRLHWRERGGPPVSAPTRTGFGSKLVRRLIEGDLGGGADIRYIPEGFEAELRFKLAGATA